MNSQKKIFNLINKIRSYGPRPQGSENLKNISAYLKEYSEKFGFECSIQEYPSIFWNFISYNLKFNNENIEAIINPYSISCDIETVFIKASSLEQLIDLANETFSDKIILLYGDLSKETLFPLEYPFYNTEQNKEFYKILINNPPLAVFFISHHSFTPQLFNIDDQFQIPTLTISPKDGKKFLSNPNQKVKLKISAENIESTSNNVIIRKKGKIDKKIVIAAHMDTVHLSPGAHDNSSGIICLLSLIEELSSLDLYHTIELVATTGHEYTGRGEFLYYSKLIQEPSNIKYFINLDGVGHWVIPDKVSFYNFQDDQISQILKKIEPILGTSEGEPWVEGLHYALSFHNIPCIAISAEEKLDIHHTPQDQYNYLNPSNLGKVVKTIKEICLI